MARSIALTLGRSEEGMRGETASVTIEPSGDGLFRVAGRYSFYGMSSYDFDIRLAKRGSMSVSVTGTKIDHGAARKVSAKVELGAYASSTLAQFAGRFSDGKDAVALKEGLFSVFDTASKAVDSKAKELKGDAPMDGERIASSALAPILVLEKRAHVTGKLKALVERELPEKSREALEKAHRPFS